jgi:tetratricopeptide (TPR) repeat protein
MDAMRRLVVYRPDLRADFIKMLMQANRPRIALQVIDQILRENPGDAARLRDRWLLLLADRRWKDALQAGEELVKADSSAATADYFSRSIAAALADSQFVLAARIGASGIAKFASDADLWTLSAQAQRKSDRRADAIASVRRALVLNPRTENAWALLVSTQIEAGELDSAIASAHLGLAAGADTTAIRGILAVPMGIAAKRADSVKTRAAWLEVVRLAALIDSVAPSPAAKFFLALGSFQVGFDALQTIDTNHRCDEAKLIEDMWAIAAINAPLGAKAGPEQARGAAQMMTVMQQYLDPVSKAKTAFCKKKR